MRVTKKDKKSNKPLWATNPHYQFGGLLSLLQAFQNTDFSDYGSVSSSAINAGGIPFANAFVADDPNMIANSVLKQSSENQARQEATDKYGALKNIPFLGDFAQKKIDESTNLNKGLNTVKSSNDYVGASGLLNLLELLQFQQGGSVSRLGYSDNSPYKNKDSITIPGNIITMENTGMPIKAVPDVGRTRILPPYSGLHVFPGATSVKEVPNKRKGGKLPKKYNYFQEGGQGAIGAQLEKGELFITPNVDIMDTAATELHKDMDKDKVTDILGGGDYVISDMDSKTITRKEAEKHSFGMGGMLYEEGEIADQPIETKAADIFKEGEDEVKMTEYLKRVRKRFTIRDSDTPDIFQKKTNAANRKSRIPYVTFVADMNEQKKKDGKDSSGYAADYENRFETAISTNANPHVEDGEYAAMPHSSQEVPTMQEGGGIDPVSMALSGIQGLMGVFTGIGQLGSNRRNYRDSLRFLQQDRADINRLAGTQSTYSGLGTAVGLAGIAGQDPTVEAPQYDTTQLDAQIRRTPRNLFDLQASRLVASSKPFLDQLFANSGSFGAAVNAYGPTAAAQASSMATLGAGQVERDINLENTYRLQKQGYADKQMLGEVGARNATRGNANQLIAGAAGQLQAGVGQQGEIQSNKLNALRSNNASRLQARINWRAGKNAAWGNIANSAGSAAQSVYSDYASQQAMLPPTTQATAQAPIPVTGNTGHVGYTPPAGMPAIPSGISSPFYFQQPGGSTYSWNPSAGQWAPYTPPVDSSLNMGPNIPQGYFDPVTQTFHFKKGGKLPKRR